MGCSFTSGIQSTLGEVASSSIVQNVAPIVAGVFLGPAGGAAVGAALGAIGAKHENTSQMEGALRGGAIGGVAGLAAPAVFGAFGTGAGTMGVGSLDAVGGLTAAQEAAMLTGSAMGGIDAATLAALGGASTGAGALGVGSLDAGTFGSSASSMFGAPSSTSVFGTGLAEVGTAAPDMFALGGTGAGTTSMGGTSAAGMFGTGAEVGTGALGSGFSGLGLDALGVEGLGTGLGAAGTGASVASGAGSTGGLWDTAKGLWDSAKGTGLAGAAVNAIGGYVQGNAAQEASQAQADAYIKAAQIAADAAKFRPVGVATAFGSSNFGYDANGNVTSAGYTLTPEMKAQQAQLMNASGGLLNQFTGAQAATAPMGQAAQSAMTLGNQYLGTSPQDQAARYMAEQQALLAPAREREMAQLQATMQAQGRGGFAMGGTSTGYGSANPQLEAMMNARRQQDLGLAAQATRGGMDYTNFGLNTVGLGGKMLTDMYGVQSGAYAPYRTALGGAQTIEELGQNAMNIGVNVGAKGQAAGQQQGQMLQSGMNNAAQSQYNANAYSPWAAPLNSAGQMLTGYRFDPNTGARL